MELLSSACVAGESSDVDGRVARRRGDNCAGIGEKEEEGRAVFFFSFVVLKFLIELANPNRPISQSE